MEVIKVAESPLLAGRAEALDLLTPERLTKNCWFTQYDSVDADAWDSAFEQYYVIPNGEIAAMGGGIQAQYNRMMSLDYTDKHNINTLKLSFPKIACAFERVLAQHTERSRRIELWKKCKSGWGTEWDAQPFCTYARELGLTIEEQMIEREFPHKRANDIRIQMEQWNDWVDTRLDTTYEDRIVVMLDFEQGLVEFSKILKNHGVPHVILQIELSDAGQHGGHQQMHLCGDGFAGTKAVNGEMYMDNDLVEFVNTHREQVPVILFNSHIPEGISLYHTRRLHVMSMDQSYANISQMIGRINRLCHTTREDKELYLYVYGNSEEESLYMSEMTRRASWPRINPVKSF
jgi:hypothetical protein